MIAAEKSMHQYIAKAEIVDFLLLQFPTMHSIALVNAAKDCLLNLPCNVESFATKIE